MTRMPAAESSLARQGPRHFTHSPALNPRHNREVVRRPQISRTTDYPPLLQPLRTMITGATVRTPFRRKRTRHNVFPRRQHIGWYRHITLSMLAHAFLIVTRSKKGPRHRSVRPHLPEPARDQTPPRQPDLHQPAEPRTRPEPVTLATTASTNRETPPLPGPRTQPLNVTAALARCDSFAESRLVGR